ncbi:MAG TPA: molybdenum cofactor guanylyltransferase [Frankiaceae bacterium]|nr:molybdenum cofactor guanylyltransferase [Frankiaceae bacterium]
MIFDAVVLAGGASRRMGGGDKTAMSLGESSLLDRALGSVTDARQTVVVGVERATQRRVTWTREEPPGGGPAAGLACALDLVTSPVVVVLAGDLPFVTPETVGRLLTAAHPAGAVMVDDSGRPQWLLSCWPTALLRQALAGDQEGRSLREQLAPLAPARLEPAGERPEWFDCDDPADFEAAKELLDEPAGRLAR